jgi:hypothetical protein
MGHEGLKALYHGQALDQLKVRPQWPVCPHAVDVYFPSVDHVSVLQLYSYGTYADGPRMCVVRWGLL